MTETAAAAPGATPNAIGKKIPWVACQGGRKHTPVVGGQDSLPAESLGLNASGPASSSGFTYGTMATMQPEKISPHSGGDLTKRVELLDQSPEKPIPMGKLE